MTFIISNVRRFLKIFNHLHCLFHLHFLLHNNQLSSLLQHNPCLHNFENIQMPCIHLFLYVISMNLLFFLNGTTDLITDQRVTDYQPVVLDQPIINRLYRVNRLRILLNRLTEICSVRFSYSIMVQSVHTTIVE